MAGMEPFTKDGAPFNFCKLIAGSAGTLVFIYRIQGKRRAPPSSRSATSPASISRPWTTRFRANISGLVNTSIMACELIDDYTINCAKGERTVLKEELFFVKGRARRCIDYRGCAGTQKKKPGPPSSKIIEDVKKTGYGYHFPIVSSAIRGPRMAFEERRPRGRVQRRGGRQARDQHRRLRGGYKGPAGFYRRSGRAT